MEYYTLRHESTDGRFIDGDVEFFPALKDYYQVGRGKIDAETKVSLVLDKRVKKLKSDFFLTTCGAFFVSEEMMILLSEHNNDLDFFEANASYFSGKLTEKTYFLIHASSKLKCFDYQNSEYSGKSMVLSKISNGELPDDYKVRGVKKLCIEMRDAIELDFFFIDEVICIDPLISETLADDAKSKKLFLNIEKV
ncbi:hypothetical protein BZK31_23805 [Pseudomonas floridensis]|uniref:Immunity MXAN-0049 protein domain-containing protein n=1 Tax=Pseudomonas floridensis TaxID=1958950 RepID=A0A1X0N1K9_9PSED|nr:DUF1629 domain-containing protein [Pseudomonas floridensis]ORC56179.1 hypothetical protein BZK31_23805 [Pseudomonas floridensis]